MRKLRYFFKITISLLILSFIISGKMFSQVVSIENYKFNIEKSSIGKYQIPIWSFAIGEFDRLAPEISKISEPDDSFYASNFPKEAFWIDLNISNPTNETFYGKLSGKIILPDGSNKELSWGIPGAYFNEWTYSIDANKSIYISIPISYPKELVSIEDIPLGEYGLYLSLGNNFSDEFISNFDVNNGPISPLNISEGNISYFDLNDYNPRNDTWYEGYKYLMELLGYIAKLKNPDITPQSPNLMRDLKSESRVNMTNTSETDIIINKVENYNEVIARWKNERQFLDYRTSKFRFDRAKALLILSSKNNYPLINNNLSSRYNIVNHIDDNGNYVTVIEWFEYGVGKNILPEIWYEESFLVNPNEDLSIDFSVSLQFGPFLNKPGSENGGVYAYESFLTNPDDVHWLQISVGNSYKNVEGKFIQDIITEELELQKNSRLGIEGIAHQSGNYYAKVFNENLIPPIKWDWVSTSTNFKEYNSGEAFSFNFYVTPNTEEEAFQIWLYRETWFPGIFTIVDKFKGIIAVEDDNGSYELSADFVANTETGTSPLTVTFQDLSEPSDKIQSWKWDFTGNGVIDSQQQNPSYTYHEPGNYTVSLTISDGNQEATETKTNFITVTEEQIENPNLTIETSGPYIKGENIQIRVRTEPVTEGIKFDFSVTPENGNLKVFSDGYTNHFGIANAEFTPSSGGTYTVTASNSQLGEISDTFNVSDQIPPNFETTYVSGDESESIYNLFFRYQGFSWNGDSFHLETNKGVFTSSGSNVLTGTFSNQTRFSTNLKVTEAVETTITLTHDGNKYDYKFTPQIVTNEEISYFKSLTYSRLNDFDWVTTDQTLVLANDRRMRKFDIYSWNETLNNQVGSHYIEAISTNRDGTKLIYADNDRLHIANPLTLSKTASSSEFFTSDETKISWAWDDSRVTAVDFENHFTLNASSLSTIRDLQDFDTMITDVDYRINNNQYAVSVDNDKNREVLIYNTSHSIVHTLTMSNEGRGMGVSYNPSGILLAATSEFDGLSIFDANNNYSLLTKISDDFNRISRVSWNPNPQTNIIALAVRDNQQNHRIYFYDANNYTRIYRSNSIGQVMKMKWSKDGSVLGATTGSTLYLFAPFHQTPPLLSVDLDEIVNENSVEINGFIENFEDFASISIFVNDELADTINMTDGDGTFNSNVNVELGSNNVKVIAKDRFLNEMEREFTVERLNNTTIFGTISDTENNPLQGVAVSISGAKEAVKETGQTGIYSFIVERGKNYQVSASLQGYSSNPVVVEISNIDTETEINFVLSEIDADLIIALNEGWNISGVPIETSSLHYQNVFNSATQEPYSFSSSYVVSTNLQKGRGYWIHLAADESVEFTGTLIQNIELNLNEGWNLVSGIGHTLPEAAVEDNQGIINSAWYGFNGAYFTAAEIEPGYGYWVRASEPGTVTLEHSAAKLLAAKQAEQPWQRFKLNEDFHALYFISGKDTLQTLYFGCELPAEIPAARFVMPPVPPTEAFDARFTGTESRLAEGAVPQIAIQAGEREVELHLHSPGLISMQRWEIVQTEDGRPVDRQTLLDGEAVALYSPDVTHIELVHMDGSFAEDGTDLPNQFALKQNYPNPFNPTTQIRYQLPVSSDVRLDVYDMTGRHVTTLVNGQVSAGTHTVTFDAMNLSSGVYMYRLQAGEFREVRRLTVIK